MEYAEYPFLMYKSNSTCVAHNAEERAQLAAEGWSENPSAPEEPSQTEAPPATEPPATEAPAKRKRR